VISMLDVRCTPGASQGETAGWFNGIAS